MTTTLSHTMREMLEDYLHAYSPQGTVREIELVKAKIENAITELEADRVRLNWLVAGLNDVMRESIDNAMTAEAGGARAESIVRENRAVM